MNKKAQGAIVGMAIVALIVVVILGVVFSFVSGVINTQDVTNESLTFTSTTTDVANESQANTGNGSVRGNYTLSFDDLTGVTEIRNSSAITITTQCNATLSRGFFSCNATNSTNLFFEYTYISGRTETLANDDLTGQPTFRNGTSGSLADDDCNATLASGAVICNNIHSATGFADYNYNPEGFITSGTTRTIVGLITVLLALLILVFIFGFVQTRS